MKALGDWQVVWTWGIVKDQRLICLKTSEMGFVSFAEDEEAGKMPYVITVSQRGNTLYC